MKRFKLLMLLVVCVLLFSGCTAKDTVVISKNGKITESVIIREDNKKVLYGTNTLEKSVKQALAEYEDALDLKDYSSKIIVGNENSGVNITKSYNGFCEFITTTIFSQYAYKKIECSENDYYYIISSKGDFIPIDSHYDTWNIPDNMEFTLKLPFSLDQNNADRVSSNTYTWVFNKNTSTSKTIEFKIDKQLLSKTIKRNKEETIERKKKEKRNKLITNIVIVSLVVFVLIVGIYVGYKVLYKKYKNNKLSY